MNGSWAATLQAAFLAALTRPAWWPLALASFVVRGGFLVVMLPLFSLPTTADLTTALAPTVEDVLLGGPSIGTVVAGILVLAGAITMVYALGYAGSWLELALLRETTADPDLALDWHPVNRSPLVALGIRISAHLPTAIALGYLSVRVVAAAYAELLSPADPATSLPLRVLGRVPDAVAILSFAWLLGETVGALTARRVAAGEPVVRAFGRSLRQVASPRGIATLITTSAVLLALVVPYVLVAGAAWQRARTALFDGADPIVTLAALVLMVSTWVLGLALLGALLAWRATAWTVQVAPRALAVTQPMLRASEPSR